MSDEENRLKALLSYNILDTGPELEFDTLTELASEICGTPIALVSLIDDKRQWFKSRVGLDAPETPREIAFCHHAIEQEDVFEVPNAADDDRFKANPLVTDDPNIRFYAGAPLNAPSGHKLGTLCVIDRVPRTLTDGQKKALQTLANQVIAQLELKKKNVELSLVAENLKQHQASLVQAEKLASLGRMAGGIAHELNNPLQILNNYMELFSKRASEVGHVKEFQDVVDKSKSTIFRMAKIIQTMLGFVQARKDTPKEEIKLENIVDDSAMLLSERLISYKGKFETQWDVDKELVISCSPVEVSQVLINLITNAIDASLNHPEPKVDLSVRKSDDGLIFSIRDNGDGVPDDVLSKVKEPFFTTKEVGQGTGLGLFISHQVADRMGGSLDYERKEGHTYFHFRVPAE